MAYNEQKIQEFINRGKQLGKSKEQIKQAYEKALQDGLFNIEEVKTQATPSYIDQVGTTMKGFALATPKTVKTIGGAIKEVGTELKSGLFDFGRDIRKQVSGDVSEPAGIYGRTLKTFGEAQEGIKQAKISQTAGKQTGTTSLLQSMGLLAGATSETIGDAFISGLKTLAPKQVEETVKTGLQNAIQSKGGQVVMGEIQKALDGYEYLKETNPEKARDYKAFFGALELTADATGLASIQKGAKTVGKKTIFDAPQGPVKSIPELTMDIPGKIKQAGVNILDKTTPTKVEILNKLKKGTQSIKEIPTDIKTTTTRSIPEKIISGDLGFTPTERAKISNITGKTESQYILEKGLAGKGKEELASIFAKQANDNFKGITNKLKALKDTPTVSKTSTEALQDILEQLTSSPKLKRAYDKDIKAVQDMLSRGKYTLAEKNAIRRAFDKVNTGMYTAQGKARSGIETKIDIDIRNDLSKEIQEEALKYGIDIGEMNKELRVGIEMKDALLRRLSQEEKNNFIGLQDIGVSAILSGGEPVSAMALIGAKKYAESMIPKVAQKVYNLNKSKNVSSRMTRGNPIIDNTKSSKLGLANSIGDNMAKSPKTPQIIKKPLALPEGKKPAIITPQTVDKGVILESKKGLEKTKIGTIEKKPTKIKKKPIEVKKDIKKPTKIEKKVESYEIKEIRKLADEVGLDLKNYKLELFNKKDFQVLRNKIERIKQSLENKKKVIPTKIEKKPIEVKKEPIIKKTIQEVKKPTKIEKTPQKIDTTKKSKQFNTKEAIEVNKRIDKFIEEKIFNAKKDIKIEDYDKVMGGYDIEDTLDINLEKYGLSAGYIRYGLFNNKIPIYDDNGLFGEFTISKVTNPEEIIPHGTKEDIIKVLEDIISKKIIQDNQLVKISENQLGLGINSGKAISNIGETANKPIKTPQKIDTTKKVGDNKDTLLSNTKKMETKTKSEIEILPKEIDLVDEAKRVGAKRIAPDRIAHQQLTPEKGLSKLTEEIQSLKTRAQKVKEYLEKNRYGDITGSEKKLLEYDSYVKGIKEGKYEGVRLKNIQRYVDSNKEFFERLRVKLDLKKFLGNKYENFKQALGELDNIDTKQLYIDLVNKDISKGYKFTDDVLNFDKSFKTAIDNRARYEKGLNTSFSADDSRIVFDKRTPIGMKRQDGKTITSEQIDEIVNGLDEFKKTTGVDFEQILKDDKVVIAHLNGKSPFLKKSAGLYREDLAGNKSLSVGGVERVSYKDAKTGEMVTKTNNTVLAHEIGHSIDYKSGNKLFKDITYEARLSFKREGLEMFDMPRNYWTQPSEVKARLIEQYVAIKNGNTKYYNRPGYWNKENFDKLTPKIEQSFKENFGDYLVKTKAIDNKSGYIAPAQILKDIEKLGKKIINPKEYNKLADDIVKSMGIAKEYTKKALVIVKEYMKKYGVELKNKLGDLFDDLADKLGVRSKFISDKGTGISDDLIKEAKPKENILENLNPTGGLYIDYTPEIRATAKLGPNITTLDKTMKVSPDTEIIIYRGAPKSQKNINAGDFVTTNYDLAKSYAGEGNVLKMKVKARDVLDDITEPLGEEYIYRPKKIK